MCGKLGAYHGEPMMARWMLKSGRTGFYAKCIEAGLVQSGDEIILVEHGLNRITIDEANRLMYRNRDDLPGIRALLEVPALSSDWRISFEQRL